MKKFILLFSFIVSSHQECRLDGPLLGVYTRQVAPIMAQESSSVYAKPLLYETVMITPFSISDYGECYEKFHESYIFGMKRMGRSMCYRCVTPVLRTPNVLQMAHPLEDVCQDGIDLARKTCFDVNSLSSLEGTFLYRKEAIEPSSCDIEGRFALTYTLHNTNLSCEAGTESEANNCEVAPKLDIRFRNCTFPDFEMSLRCLGSWEGNHGNRYTIMENIEKEEYRCGLVVSSAEHIKIHFSNDSSCAHLNPQSAFETYTFAQVAISKPVSPCAFPEALIGEYYSLKITPTQLHYNQGSSDSVPTVSFCVSLHGERVLVYSESKCGDPVGFHCMWLRMRSDTVLEMRTTSPTETLDATTCERDDLFEGVPWTTLSVRRPTPVNCALMGTYRTPATMRSEDCYVLSIDCEQSTTMKISAYQCSSGVVFETRSYNCLATWRDGAFSYQYTKKAAEDAHVCFITQTKPSRLFLSSSGPHCSRDFSFTDNNNNNTLVLEQEDDCSTVSPSTPSGLPSPARRPLRPPTHPSPGSPAGRESIAQAAPIYTPDTTTEGTGDEPPPTWLMATASNYNNCESLIIFLIGFIVLTQ